MPNKTFIVSNIINSICKKIKSRRVDFRKIGNKFVIEMNYRILYLYETTKTVEVGEKM